MQFAIPACSSSVPCFSFVCRTATGVRAAVYVLGVLILAAVAQGQAPRLQGTDELLPTQPAAMSPGLALLAGDGGGAGQTTICNFCDVSPIGSDENLTGRLQNGDCELTGTFFIDVYSVDVVESATLNVTASSDDGGLQLFLTNGNCDALAIESGEPSVVIDRLVEPGTYFVAVAATAADTALNYSLTTLASDPPPTVCSSCPITTVDPATLAAEGDLLTRTLAGALDANDCGTMNKFDAYRLDFSVPTPLSVEVDSPEAGVTVIITNPVCGVVKNGTPCDADASLDCAETDNALDSYHVLVFTAADALADYSLKISTPDPESLPPPVDICGDLCEGGPLTCGAGIDGMFPAECTVEGFETKTQRHAITMEEAGYLNLQFGGSDLLATSFELHGECGSLIAQPGPGQEELKQHVEPGNYHVVVNGPLGATYSIDTACLLPSDLPQELFGLATVAVCDGEVVGELTSEQTFSLGMEIVAGQPVAFVHNGGPFHVGVEWQGVPGHAVLFDQQGGFLDDAFDAPLDRDLQAGLYMVMFHLDETGQETAFNAMFTPTPPNLGCPPDDAPDLWLFGNRHTPSNAVINIGDPPKGGVIVTPESPDDPGKVTIDVDPAETFRLLLEAIDGESPDGDLPDFSLHVSLAALKNFSVDFDSSNNQVSLNLETVDLEFEPAAIEYRNGGTETFSRSVPSMNKQATIQFSLDALPSVGMEFSMTGSLPLFRFLFPSTQINADGQTVIGDEVIFRLPSALTAELGQGRIQSAELGTRRLVRLLDETRGIGDFAFRGGPGTVLDTSRVRPSIALAEDPTDDRGSMDLEVIPLEFSTELSVEVETGPGSLQDILDAAGTLEFWQGRDSSPVFGPFQLESDPAQGDFRLNLRDAQDRLDRFFSRLDGESVGTFDAVPEVRFAALPDALGGRGNVPLEGDPGVVLRWDSPVDLILNGSTVRADELRIVDSQHASPHVHEFGLRVEGPTAALERFELANIERSDTFVYGGLPNHPIGGVLGILQPDALLGLIPPGADAGFSIPVGPEVGLQLDLSNVAAMPEGGSIRVASLSRPASKNGVPDTVISSVDITKAEANAVYGARAVSGVVNVITRKDFEGFEISETFPYAAGTGIHIDLGPETRVNVVPWERTPDGIQARIDWNQITTVVRPDTGEVLSGNRLVFHSADPVLAGAEQTAVTIEGKNLPFFPITHERIVLSGIHFEAQGDAIYTQLLDGVSLGNFGAAGLDGVFVQPDGPADCLVLDLTVDGTLEGSQLSAHARFRGEDPDLEFFLETNYTFEMAADWFSARGSEEGLTLDVFDGGERVGPLVLSESGIGVEGLVSPSPNRYTVRGGNELTATLHMNSPMSFTDVEGTSLTGDSLVVTMPTPSNGMPKVESIEFFPSAVTSLTLKPLGDDCETGIPTAGGQIPGDCNQDGNLDVSDAACILGFLFLGDPMVLPCGDGSRLDPANVALLDFPGNGDVELNSAVNLLIFLFLGGSQHVLGRDCVMLPGCPQVCDP